jgi:ubiquinone/menaquinone biosynthesis C-methylase UbiE
MTLPAYALDKPTFPQMYERHLVGPLFRPWAAALLDEAAPQEGERVLDVACGTGIVARLSRERVGATGRVTGVDLSAQMLQVARELAPGIDWREGDAAALPVRAGEAFDVVLCQQGLQFFADRPAAARQMRGALAVGGRLAASTWRPIAEAPVFRETHRIAESCVGPILDQRHAFGDQAELAGLLEQAGFAGVRTRTVAITLRFAEPAALARLNAMALVGMSAASKRLDDGQRERAIDAIAAESMDAFAPYLQGGDLVFETTSNVATARAP